MRPLIIYHVSFSISSARVLQYMLQKERKFEVLTKTNVATELRNAIVELSDLKELFNGLVT